MENTETNMVVANTILSQLGGIGRLKMMIGGKHFLGDDISVDFQWTAKSRNKAKSIHITLEPSDTYTVKFLTAECKKTFKSKIVSEYSDVYAEDLIPLFERETGLYLQF